MLVGLSACAKVQHWVLDNQNLTAPAPVGLGWFIQGWFLRPEVCYKKNICQQAQAQSFATEDELVQWSIGPEEAWTCTWREDRGGPALPPYTLRHR